MTSEPVELDIAIIGAGLSGTLTALQLARQAPGLSIGLIERGARPGIGLAYSTPDLGHLLNVRADRMSAFPSEPDGFVRWLEKQDGENAVRADTDAGVFVSRQAYGRYLQDLLERARSASDGRLQIVSGEVTAVLPLSDGYELALVSGTLQARLVVLAMGNLAAPFVLPDGSEAINPWNEGAFDGLAPDAPVAIIGTGLTMIDVVTSLRRQGHHGPVTAISRRGLKPHGHAPLSALPEPRATGAMSGPLSLRLKRLRAAACAYGWREVMDCLRPLTQALWQGLSTAEKQRFLRHARPWWDIHRHRIAAPVAAMLDSEMSQGRLTILAGRIIDGGSRDLTLALRGSDQRVLHPARIFDATGFGPLRHSPDPLIRNLMQSGLAASDKTGLGIAVDDTLAVMDADHRSQGLYAVGPMVRGVYWECTAVPDIRVQAEALARHLAQRLEPVQRDQA